MNLRISAHWRLTSLGASPWCGVSAWIALFTASSSMTLTASSRAGTANLTRDRSSESEAVTAAIGYAATSHAFIACFLVMIPIAARHHITRHQGRMRQDGRARSKEVRWLRSGCTLKLPRPLHDAGDL